MPIVAADLVAYGPANLVEDDTSTAGGDRVVARRPNLDQFSASAIPHIESDNAGDTTQTVTIVGRNAAGAKISEVQTLNGTTPVAFTNTFERILKVTKSATTTGTVLVKQGSGGTTRVTLAPAELISFAFFIDASSDPSAQKDRYELIYWQNTHGTLSLTSATVDLTADPASKILFKMHTAVGNAGTITNRKTSPGGTFLDDNNPTSLPGDGNLDAGEYIGVWINQRLSAGDSPVKNSFTTKLAGTTA